MVRKHMDGGTPREDWREMVRAARAYLGVRNRGEFGKRLNPPVSAAAIEAWETGRQSKKDGEPSEPADLPERLDQIAKLAGWPKGYFFKQHERRRASRPWADADAADAMRRSAAEITQQAKEIGTTTELLRAEMVIRDAELLTQTAEIARSINRLEARLFP